MLKFRGFTLVELLVTISILAILMTIAMISYSGIQKNARDGKRKSDISIIQSALEQYHADSGYYPASPLSAGSALSNGSKIYLSKIPGDNDGSSYFYTALPNSPACNTNCTNYCLYATLENSSNQVLTSQCEPPQADQYQYQVQAP